MIYLYLRLYRFNKAAQSKDSSMIRKNIGRPTPIPNEPSLRTETACSTKSLRSSTEPYIKTLCIICQKRKISEDTHKVKVTRKGLRMLQVAKEIEDKDFFIRLNIIPNPEDAFANGVIYHRSCWIYKQREASKDETFDENHNDMAKVKSDIEIINIVKSELIYSAASTLDMNNVNNTYIELLKDNNCTDIKTNYKSYLKQLIKENISIAEFIKPNQKNCLEKICTKSKKDYIVDSALECKTDIYDQIFETAIHIRKGVNANKS